MSYKQGRRIYDQSSAEVGISLPKPIAVSRVRSMGGEDRAALVNEARGVNYFNNRDHLDTIDPQSELTRERGVSQSHQHPNGLVTSVRARFRYDRKESRSINGIAIQGVYKIGQKDLPKNWQGLKKVLDSSSYSSFFRIINHMAGFPHDEKCGVLGLPINTTYVDYERSLCLYLADPTPDRRNRMRPVVNRFLGWLSDNDKFVQMFFAGKHLDEAGSWNRAYESLKKIKGVKPEDLKHARAQRDSALAWFNEKMGTLKQTMPGKSSKLIPLLLTPNLS